MPTFLAPITVTDEFVTGNETISGNETILGVTSGRGSYWTSVSMTGGLTADSGSFVNNVSATAFYGDGSHLTGISSGNYLSASGGTLNGGLTGTEGVFTSLLASTLSGVHQGDGSGIINLNASNISSGTLSAARLPVFEGDITTSINNTVSTTVTKLQGNQISTASPSNGQILQWNGTAWVPGSIATGGSGGGGVTYYFDYAHYAGISPTAGLPTSPVAPSLLGREYFTGAEFIQTGELINGSYSLVAGFVSMSSEPAVTDIPAGLWDFNIWMDVVGGTGGANQTQVKVVVHKYNPITSTYTSIASSDDVFIYDPVTIAQYIANVTMPQTTILSSDRIYIELYAQKNVNQSRKVRVHTDSLHPSHVHTTLPSVAGSGLVKTVNGVMQTPASLLVDVDVAANAAIAQSKINGLTTALDTKAKQTQVQIFTSNSTWTKPDGAKSVQIELVGGGGGGGSGRKGASGTACGGGGSGAGGGFTSRSIEASLLDATIPVVVGIGGAGANGQTSTSTNGIAGSPGGNSTFGTWTFAGGGTAGGGGTVAGGSAGISGSRAMFAGGGGALGGTTATAAAGGGTQCGGGGGGGGGGVSGAVPAFFNGGLGRLSVGTFLTQGDTAGGTTDGANGTAGISAPTNYVMGGSGGGGGAGSINAANNGGNGGAGGSYGGGGGGGGACLDTNASSGAGGNGAPGIVVVTTYF